MVLLGCHHCHSDAGPGLHMPPCIFLRRSKRGTFSRILVDDTTRTELPRCSMLHSVQQGSLVQLPQRCAKLQDAMVLAKMDHTVLRPLRHVVLLDPADRRVAD